MCHQGGNNKRLYNTGRRLFVWLTLLLADWLGYQFVLLFHLLSFMGGYTIKFIKFVFYRIWGDWEILCWFYDPHTLICLWQELKVLQSCSVVYDFVFSDFFIVRKFSLSFALGPSLWLYIGFNLQEFPPFILIRCCM